MSQHTEPPPEPPLPSKLPPQTVALIQRHAKLVIVFALGVALAGFLRGTSDPGPLQRNYSHPAEAPEDAPAAVTYSELPNAKIKANANFKTDLEQLLKQRPGPFDPVVRTEEMKQAALADRSRNRAYEGAPPTIPHPVTATQTTSCLSCHQVGLPVGDRVAPKVSHPHYTNCTQCHVESKRSDTPWAAEAGTTENAFSGVGRAGPGSRAWAGAPPTIPHTTLDAAGLHELPRHRRPFRDPHDSPLADQLHPVSRPVRHPGSGELRQGATMTTEHAPPLAPVWEKLIDPATLAQFFAELKSHARLLSVSEKGGPTQYAGNDHLDLATVQAHLTSGATYAVQLRYDYDGQEWCDTVLRAHDGWKLLRMKQSSC